VQCSFFFPHPSTELSHQHSTIYKPAEIEISRKLARIIILLLLLFMGSMSAAEIQNLETYNELNFLATIYQNQKYQN